MMFVADVGLGELLWSILSIFFILMYLMMLFSVVTDLFRDHELSGGWKALWLICLLFIPLLSLIVYVIVRGDGMAKRQARAMGEADEATRAYIRDAAGGTAADQIAQAKALLDQGAINQEEYERLKAKALGD